jgi:F0F1-type ATP synthase assembly protein I
MKKQEDGALKVLALVSAFAFQMILLIGGFVFIGLTIDRNLDTSPFMVIIFGLLGIAIGIFRLIKTASDMEEKNGKD